MVNLENDYLSSSALQEPMDIAYPPQPSLSFDNESCTPIADPLQLNISLDGKTLRPAETPLPLEEADPDLYSTPPTSDDGHSTTFDHVKISSASSLSFPSSPHPSPPLLPRPPPKRQPKSSKGSPVKSLIGDFSPGSSDKSDDPFTQKGRV